MFPFKKLEEKYRDIPDDVREAISSVEVNKKLRDLTDKYKLQFDEAENLTKEIGFVMLGLKPRQDFVKNIQIATELDYETSKLIAEDVNNLIFHNVRESLKKIHGYDQKQNSNQGESDEENENLDESQVRDELIKEIEKPAEKQSAETTELLSASEPKKQIMSASTETKDSAPVSDSEKPEQSNPQPAQHNPPKKDIIDQYREPID